jgi:TRAP-type C4-dicarboxylate transport system substrate-binding protein
MGTLATSMSSWMRVAEKWSDKIREETSNRIKIIWYGGGIMGDEPDMVRKILLGQLDGGGFTGMGLGKISPELCILYLPFLFENYGEVDFVLKNFKKTFNEILERKKVLILGWAEMGFIYLFSKKEIKTFEDLKGLKIWIWAGDPVANAVSEELSTISSFYPVSVPEVLTSLRTGIVDTFYSSPLATVALQWHTEVKFVIDVPFAYGDGAIIMRKDSFDKIPDEWKEVLLKNFQKMGEEMTLTSRKENEIALKEIIEGGVTRLSLKGDEFIKIKKIVKRSYTRLKDKIIPSNLIEDIEKAIEKIRMSSSSK